jgi:hypothetical protein
MILPHVGAIASFNIALAPTAQLLPDLAQNRQHCVTRRLRGAHAPWLRLP